MIQFPNLEGFFGIVENVFDPMEIGRIQVRVHGLHSENIPVEFLPWFHAIVSNSAGKKGLGNSPTGYVQGSDVFGFFLDPEYQKGIVIGSLTGFLTEKESEVGNVPSGVEGANAAESNVGSEFEEESGSVDGESDFDDDSLISNDDGCDSRTKIPDSVLKGAMPNIDKKKWKCSLQKAMDKYDISGDRAAMFLAQLGHESNDLKRQSENLNYTSAERIQQIWPSRFPTKESAEPYVRNPKGLANKVYNGRMGNRPGTDDGWNYRGKGPIQLTGRKNNEDFSRETGYDTISDPDLLLNDPEAAAASAAWYFNKYTKGTDIVGVTRSINGGTIGLADRKERYERAIAAYRNDGVEPEPEQTVSQGGGASNEEIKITVGAGRVPDDIRRADGNTAYYLIESDVNRLARKEKFEHWMFEAREGTRVTKVKTALLKGSDWEEPPYLNAAVYPFNKTFESLSGHVEEFDDTEDFQRIHEYHRSGTYKEIHPNGDKTVRIVGDSYEIVAGAKSIQISGDCNLTVSGNLNQHVSGNWNIQVDGDKNEYVLGKTKFKTKNLEIESQKDINTYSFKQNHFALWRYEIGSFNHFKASALFNVDIDSKFNMHLMALNEQNLISRTHSNTVHGTHSSIAQNRREMTREKHVVESGGLYSLKALGQIVSDATFQHHQMNASEPANVIPKSKFVFVLDDVDIDFNIALPVVYDVTQIPPPVYEYDRVIEFDEPAIIGFTPEEYPRSDQEDITLDLIAQSDINDVFKETVDNFVPIDTEKNVISDALKLTPNFNVGDLTNGTLLRPDTHNLIDQGGLTKEDIANNLKGLAEEVLEPILEKFGEFDILSGFRIGNFLSDHTIGTGVDIDSSNWTNKQKIEIAEWAATNLPIENVILEQGKKTWLHFAYDRNNTEHFGKTYTMINEKFEDGLKLYRR